jgi:hypothetical protein
MKLLVITDYPITSVDYMPNWAYDMASVEAGPNRVSVVFAGDLLKNGTIPGMEYSMVLMPKSIKPIEEVYEPVRKIVMPMVCMEATRIIEYENSH